MRRWLDAYPSAEAARAIAGAPALLEEARALLPALEAEVAPAGEEGVRQALLPLFGLYPQPDRSEAEWAMWWSHYIEDLSGFCPASLEAAVRAYRRLPGSRFMPLPGELRALAKAQVVPAIGRLWRVRQAVGAGAPHLPPTPAARVLPPGSAAPSPGADPGRSGPRDPDLPPDSAERMRGGSTAEGRVGGRLAPASRQEPSR